MLEFTYKESVYMLQDYKDVLDLLIKTIKEKKNLEIHEITEILNTAQSVYEAMYDTKEEEVMSYACKHCLQFLLPYTEVLLSKKAVTSDEKSLNSIYGYYRAFFAFVARRSLEHFIIFMEWDKSSARQVYLNRKEVLQGFVYYLNKIAFDPKLKYIIASFPPSYGKSFAVNYYTAWTYGLDMNAGNLRISYSEELVNGFSRSIKDLISDPKYAEIFPDFKRFGGKCFDKEKDSDWKIKGSDMIVSHYSRTREGAITGVRANKNIMFDDLTKGKQEATDSKLHIGLYDKWKTEWFNRRDGSHVNFIFVGTMWSPEDILNKVREDREIETEFVPSKLFKYTWESKNGETVVIRVPLLDENDKSTCEEVMTTKEALFLRETTDEYLFSCVYQQDPIAPSGLVFANENLVKYDIDEVNLQPYSKAVLDPARRGKDNVSMPILRQTFDFEESPHCLVDVLYQQKAMTDLYDDIVRMIIENNVIELVIENNIDTSLAYVIETKLHEKGYNLCEIKEKYATKNKEQRIKDSRGIILKNVRFKERGRYAKNSDYGRFMSDLEKYSFDFANKHDDAPDSLAMYVNEIILEKGKVNKVRGIDRSKLGI